MAATGPLSGLRRKKSLRLLARIERAAEPAAAIELVSMFPDLRGELRQRTAEVVGQLLGRLAAEGVLDFCRSAWGARGSIDMSPHAGDWIGRQPSWMAGVLGVCTCHHNGYVREAALRALGPDSVRSVEAFVLLRLNDHVPQVRSAAERLILRGIEEGRGEEWTRWLPILCRLVRAPRADQAEVIARVENVIRCSNGLLEAFDSEDREVRRYACSLALPRADAVERGLRSVDPIIRLHSARFAIERDPGRAPALARDSYPPIRRVVLEASPERAREFLFDSSRSVRTRARTLLPEDASPIYREAIERGGEQRLIALRGLAECGDQSDQSRFVAALTDCRPTIRAAALGGLARVSTEPPTAEASIAMGDASPRVRRAAIRILFRHRLVLDESRVQELLESARDPSSIRHALALASALPKWVAGTLILEATRSRATEAAQARFAWWVSRFNHSFETATPAQIDAFRSAAATAALDVPVRSALDHILRTL